ncbi:Uncharacterized protein HSBGL_1550 [Halapricum desulfuricans]|uniref:Uncharacterized protein n=1 Tax=Halapricum desulfuricans TaxID=2841257 RepID=A0A897NGX8_9EURY|nr:DUF5797 family protein [Halapricum desulfuricans]QSG11967.1 Uncharacterized protein HSBGL_1550 [Halapricum desulfuricans]
MTLEETAKRRLADVVALAPTKNSELQDRWDMDSGSEVHQYLESELKDYYYRNEDSLICATPEGRRIVQEAGLVEGTDDDQHITVPPIQARVLEVIAGPDEATQSVVSVYHALEDAGHDDYEVEDVRSALHSLVEKGVLERVRKTVPTFRLAVERSELAVDELE